MTGVLQRLARGAPVPVLVVAGADARPAAELLGLDRRLDVVDAPRQALVLLVVGTVPAGLSEQLGRVHDAMAHPRATLWWPARDGAAGPPLIAERVPDDAEAGAACVDVAAALLSGARAGEAPVLPDVERHPWRGVGPYGQGGNGMTGGTPYGRPLAPRADDLRDALTLDVVQLDVGPFFPALPTGMVLRVGFVGDVVSSLTLVRAPDAATGDDLFARATRAPVPVAELERARAASHLRWAARSARLLGLRALATRVLRATVELDPVEVRSVARRLRRAVAPVTRGVGRLDPSTVAGLGPVARASGVAEDARSADPAYAALGFAPIVGGAGDVWARWHQRLAEAEQSLQLAARAGDVLVGGAGSPVEGPAGRLPAAEAPLDGVLQTLVGQEWDDAVATLASLDLEARTAPSVGDAAA